MDAYLTELALNVMSLCKEFDLFFHLFKKKNLFALF